MVNMYVRYNLLETSTTKTKEILINPGTLDNSAQILKKTMSNKDKNY